ncbi:hypothetical protein GSI_11782 [Ganoderma sinense ZZ0214-1]|uniref:Uncharacterized protein n=1 Tax=Ganoderma sinense ZZ0214-1 TaxID=1077348 RepID=A0A2G8RXI2_9APHY|nr:hypothetical protein GSI_11782 [Ganoderma sinense ZZ0214-1]
MLSAEEPGGSVPTVSSQGPTTQEQWEKTLSQLRSINETLQKRRTEAEKDRDLFRDLYSKASLHASEVSKENNELAERATLAESQARDGLAMIKATYDERIRLLEQEVERWKGQVHVLTERDRRMNDELRLRAALEPELRRENMRLREQLEILILEEDCRRMEGRQVERTSGLPMEETVRTPVISLEK